MNALTALRPQYPAPRPQAMLYSDIDDSLIGWESYNQGADEVGLERTADVVRRHRESLVSGLSTSRGLTEIRRLAPLLRRFPLDFLGANNGQQLFVNAEHRPADEWILSLSDADADAAWSREARSAANWDLPRVMGALGEQLAEEGFAPAARMAAPLETLVNFTKTVDGTSILFSYYPDQPSFAIRNGAGGKLTPAHETFGKRFLARLEERLAGVQLKSRDFPYPGDQRLFLIEPEGLDKASLLRHLVTRYPSTTRVITAGDADNDTHLHPREYEGVPNCRILAGGRDSLEQALAGQERVLHRPSGDIGPALEEYLLAAEPGRQTAAA